MGVNDMNMKHMLIVGILIMIIAISGCASQNTQQPGVPSTTPPVTTPPTTTPPAPATGGLGIKKDIEISNFAFNPEVVTIPKGATVIWTNLDSASHTVVSDSGNEIVSDPIPKGQSYAHTFNTAGTYSYHCGVHPSMVGTIIVE
jgi:plastocyanin